MHREDRLRLLDECKNPIRADEGTAYLCSQRDLDGYVRFHRSNKNIVYVSPNRGTNNLVRWLDINKNPDSETAAALERLKQGIRIQNWGPDLLIKAFKDLDQAFFMGTLTGNVLVQWKNTREISDLWGLGSSRGVTWGSTFKMGHGQARISINSKPHFTEARDPHREMWRTMLHEMCHAYLLVVCGHADNTPWEARTSTSRGGHGLHFRRCVHSVDRRADRYLGLSAIGDDESDYYEHI